MKVETWLAYELTMTSAKEYGNPFEDVDVDAIFVCDGKELRFPAFWDGGKTWCVRFALPFAGTWGYRTASSDSENEGFIHSGSIECVPYTGEEAIYRHGFVKTVPGTRYFVYDDGTPFFYLGDTHWNFACEELDEPGPHAENTGAESHFKYIVDRRKEQGFTVYQSEPIGAGYNLSDGLTEAAIAGFRDLDRRFRYIADKGLLHANAQLVFPRELIAFRRKDDAYLEKLSRYWVARYAAFPVLWTMGQEVDNDFYYTRGDQRQFTKETNPFKKICTWIYRNDPFRHPITAHMEYTSLNPGPGGDGTCVSTSAFRETEGHTWYGFQWSMSLCNPMDYEFAKDAMMNGQGKVSILYESRYDYLWTKHFGARAEGWNAYLNGLYGYGYGAIDIWLYKSTYDIDRESDDGVEVVTPENKQVHWGESVEFETAYQMGYMRRFFEALEWWKLIPRFDSPSFFVAEGAHQCSIATDERKTMVIYFFNQDYRTGMLNNLDNAEYTYQWFNPRSGEYSPAHLFVGDSHRSYRIEQKPDKKDWVLLIRKN